MIKKVGPKVGPRGRLKEASVPQTIESTLVPPAQAGSPPGRRLFGLDRFSIALAVGVVVLITALFILVLSQPATTPVDESTPSGALQNYFLALQKRDLAKAYTYFSQATRERLTYERFVDQVPDQSGAGSVRIDKEQVTDDTAIVTVNVTRY